MDCIVARYSGDQGTGYCLLAEKTAYLFPSDEDRFPEQMLDALWQCSRTYLLGEETRMIGGAPYHLAPLDRREREGIESLLRIWL